MPPPTTRISTGWSSSPFSSTMVAVWPEFHSTAETRSFGLDTVPDPPSPSRFWLTATRSGSTGVPSTLETTIAVSPLGLNTSKNSSMRSSGV